MPTDSAKSLKTPLPMAFLLFKGTKLLDFAGPLQVFNDAKLPDGTPAYDVHLLSDMGGLLSTDTVCRIETKAVAECQVANWDTVLVSGGNSAYEAMQSDILCSYINTSAASCRRLGSICLGAFVLAACGRLSGRRATTHWDGVAKLSADYSDICVQDDAIFVEDNGIWTSAGVTAGIDMAIEMVRRDLGTAEAVRIAKSLLLPMLRSGGQRQFSRVLAAQTASSSHRFSELVEFIASNLKDHISVAKMAAKAGMSERNFSRKFVVEIGVSPAQFVEKLRVEHAAAMLHQNEISLATVRAEAGFTNDENMRRAFQRQLSVSPSAYASQFAALDLESAL
ncbi:helix-turn-helix domain-containing protein [Octadecabacter sp. 1_MG-2023]|uniref:GlxA family transcriptional regulator n=1 Tax=unclassified Octadecabacter TaxID=196158 RepID=UPI001C08B79C|nr:MULTISPECIES: helix-turn-helix domain-containing protein [unclassified Octadecabacter]MBU2993687.1 helix-turn-helix domain-containing protein [Octadecabacter sp. B2R22]MDO6735469.1 helix-turn-helix domain-containing protein [Octadecabacter sp. 1_MG-2023]